MNLYQKWEVIIPIENYFRIEQTPIRIGDVEVKNVVIEGKITPVALTVVDFEVYDGLDSSEPFIQPLVEVANDKAYGIVDKALATLSFAAGTPAVPKREYYSTLLEARPSLSMELADTFKKRVVEGKALPVEKFDKLTARLSEIENLPEQKRLVFDKAAALYREALHASNPLISLILYFSSISAILRDGRKTDINRRHMKDALKEVSDMEEGKFVETFDLLYGNDIGRSAVDHGWLDVTDPTLLFHTKHDSVLRLGSWTRALLQKYIADNSS